MSTDSSSQVTRRDFLAASAGTAMLFPCATAAAAPAAAEGVPHQATGVRVGEVTENSAIVWTRLTRHSQRNNEGIVFSKRGDQTKDRPTEVPVEQIEGACPGMAGRVRLRFGLSEELTGAAETAWVNVTDETDFIHQFHLSGLKPDSTYYYACEAAPPGAAPSSSEFRGKFFTAPERSTASAFRFCVMTCQGYPDRDHPDGHPIYPSMFVCGDRHWQYHSVHPTAGTQEFSVGAASNSHAGGTPGENPAYHRFHRVKGGFLSVELRVEGSESVIAFQLRDVDGKVAYEAKFRRTIA